MPVLDLPLDQLRDYRPATTAREDFDAFWAATLAEHAGSETVVDFDGIDTPLATIETFDVTFAGFDDQPVKAWLHLPRHRNGSLPCVVQYMGYGTGRGTPVTLTNLLYSAAGYANLIVDNRGQVGSDTADGDAEQRAQASGFLTQGILDPETYYYRRLIVDAVRAIGAAAAHPEIDAERLAVAGGSQGAALALAAAALDGTPVAVLADLPFLSHLRRAADVASAGPYLELTKFGRARPELVERAFTTLTYFDAVNFAPRSTASARFSAALMDDVAPASTVFAAYNNYAGPKTIDVYPFNGHEGGGQLAAERRLAFLSEVFGTTDAAASAQRTALHSLA
ncbi:acetylxylan esterase [Planctomonas sp. JC2975]|uniref:acetylxylan esterase n=1 Tax=Planctomonas sp. JC2975 TaxID=2729626 RepID=UPI0014750B07|nr:acetylxylan esterase [Planctomonas sp. JC2975]NNC13532.1 acetylxylan esterase [Planctomonas sp. JC2975]